MRRGQLAGFVALALTLGLATRVVAQAAGTDSQLPSPPTIDDPMLAPPPPAARVLRSWDEALSLVRSQSPDYLATVDNVLRAEAQTRVALAGILPSLGAQLTFTHQLVTTQLALDGPPVTYPPQDAWGLGATLTWPVGDPRAYYARGTAERNVEAARLALSEKRRTIAQGIVIAMLGTLAAERVAELNRVGLRGALERLALAQTKARLGSGTTLDVERAQQDVAAARAQVITGDEALRQSREALGLALGSKDPIAAPGGLDLGEFEKAVTSTCRLSDDVEHRPDVETARARVALADRSIQDVKLQFAPSFAVQSQALWGSQVLFGPNTTWALLGVLNIPIWDGGARYGLWRDAAAAADQARQLLASTRLGALVELAQASRAVSVATASAEVARQQRDLALSIDRRTREGYLHGLGTSLDLVISAQSLRQAELNLVLLQFQTARARVLAVLSNAECVF